MKEQNSKNSGIGFQERRRDVRYEFVAPYRFNLAGKEYTGNLRNISKNGAYLSGQAFSIPDSCQHCIGELHIEIHGREFSCKAQVVYLYHTEDAVFPIGAGVMFTEVDADSRELLLGLISAYQLSEGAN